MILLAIFLLLLIPLSAMAAPTISSTSGTWSHGNAITITSGGNNFGSKANGAAPEFWDNCEDRTVNLVSSVTAKWTYARMQSYTGGDYYKNALYQTIPYNDPDDPGADVEAPHSYSTKYLTGTAYNYQGSNAFLMFYGNDSNTSTDIFMTYYYRVQNTVDCSDTDGQNDKHACIGNDDGGNCVSGGGSDYYIVAGGYDGSNSSFCDINSPQMSAYYGPDSLSIVAANTDESLNQSARTTWVRNTYIGKACVTPDSSGFLRVYQNGELTLNYSGRDFFSSTQDDTGDVASCPMKTAGIYDYVRLCYTCDGMYLRTYYDDVYIDFSHARVFLTNNSTWTEGTSKPALEGEDVYPHSGPGQDFILIQEPQIPSAWATGEITITVNIGKLVDNPSGYDAYLYVCDSDNNCNSSGYGVELDETPSTTTTTASATGLSITGIRIQ